MPNKTPILFAVPFLCCALTAWAGIGGNATGQETKGTRTTEDVAKMSEHRFTNRGGDGGSVSRWERDHTITIFTGEQGHVGGQGGQGGSPTDTANAWQVSSNEDGILIRGQGRVARISWKDVETLRKNSQ
jgi:hypothetical protein